MPNADFVDEPDDPTKDTARELFPIVDLRHGSKLSSDPRVKDFRPMITKLDGVVEPTDVELAMLEEQIEVAAELGVEPDEVNAPLEIADPEAHRPKERSKQA